MGVKDQSLQSLKLRQMLGRQCLRVLRQAEVKGEEGAAEAKIKYERQLREITQEIKVRMKAEREARGEEKPEKTTVGMKTAQLGAKALS